jgi:DNA-binding LacI/PurR family transcriptional regulator
LFPVSLMPSLNHSKKIVPPSVTLYQVADLAGVSHQTVSRVVNRSPLVTARTRTRVLEAIKQLDYRPNKAARNLAARRSTLIGVITYAAESYGPSHAVVSISQSAMRLGYHLVLASAENPTPAEVKQCANQLREYGVDGFILNVPLAIELTVLERIFAPAPYVIMDANGGRRYPTVAIDHLAGSRRATEYLIEAGHRRIACVSGPLSWRCASLRRLGWRQALAAHRLPLGPACEGEWSAEGGYQAAQTLLKTNRRFSGVVAANDQMALGIVEALAQAGLKVPKDISVIGFDNMPESRYFRPPLTTIHHDFDLLGATSLEFVTELIADPNTVRRHRNIVPQLVIRDSVRALHANRSKQREL